MSTKHCPKCGLTKPRVEFHIDRSKNTGTSSWCKRCTNGKDKNRYASVKAVATRLCTSAHTRAREKNIEFSLTQEEVIDLMSTGCCAVTGIPFDICRSTQEAGGRPWAPSLDRLDNSKGYTKDNVRVVCWIYNRARGTSSDDLVLMMARALVERAG